MTDTMYDIEAAFRRRDEVDKKLDELAKEKAELDLTIKVLERYSPSAMGPKLGPARPDNLPSLFEMTEEVLLDAVSKGSSGLSAKEIVSEIRDRYWPGLKPQQVLPNIYQFAKKGRIRKNSDGKFLPNAAYKELSLEATQL